MAQLNVWEELWTGLQTTLNLRFDGGADEMRSSKDDASKDDDTAQAPPHRDSIVSLTDTQDGSAKELLPEMEHQDLLMAYDSDRRLSNATSDVAASSSSSASEARRRASAALASRVQCVQMKLDDLGRAGAVTKRTESWVGAAVALSLVQTGKGSLPNSPMAPVVKQGSARNRRGSLWASTTTGGGQC